MSGYLTGQLSEEQLEALNAWIKADKRNKRYFDEMRALWLAAPTAFPGKMFDKEAAYRLFLSRTKHKTADKAVKKPRFVFGWVIRAAAAVVIGFLAGTLFMRQANKRNHPQPVTSQYDIEVPNGSRNRLTLIDGTKVWLNAGSHLRYASDFGYDSREVYLEGEGFFEVARDTTKLFVVKTDKLDVKALGTSFNVKAYPDEENIETILVSGTVSIGDVVLAPNEKLIYTKSNRKTIIEKKSSEAKQPDAAAAGENKQITAVLPSVKIVEAQVNPLIHTTWKDELWRVERVTLKDFAVQLERRYDVKIHFANSSTQAMNINASIKDESIEQVLRYLQMSIPIEFNIEGKSIILKENTLQKEKYRNYYKQNN